MKKCAKTFIYSRPIGGDINSQPDPWQEIRLHAQMEPDRKIAAQDAWDEGGRLISRTLLMALMEPENSADDALKIAYKIAWGLPLHILDKATKIAESLFQLRFSESFAFNPFLTPSIQIFESKAEANSYIKSTPFSRKPLQAEIDSFLLEMAFAPRNQ